MPRTIHLTVNDKRLVRELYKSHHTVTETQHITGFSYNTIRMYYHGFGMMGIEKYNRLDFVPEEILHDAECYTG